MRRSSLIALVSLTCAALACSDEKKTPAVATGARSEAVLATAQAAAPPPAAHPPAPRPAAPRRLCGDVPSGRSLPSAKVDHLEAAGAPALADHVPTGKWLWVNLWAAWCGPCKEEIPRLRAWEAKLAAGGMPVTLAFLSLDDDERQARRFLDDQPSGGLRASFWLPESKRASWLDALKIRDTPVLPMHLFFDPQGALRCIANGAVEEPDYAQIQALITQR